MARVPLSVVDLFCGAGGISEGFRQAGFAIKGGVDNDPDAMATFAANFPEAESIVGDIRNAAVRKKVLASGLSVDVLVGGPPCQAFSQVRNHSRLIDDPRNSLYREFVKVLNVLRPEVFVMENVTGIDQMGVREQISEDLSLRGDYVVRAQVLDAADFGVPQTRKRLLFIGAKSGNGISPPIIVGSGATSAIELARVKSRGKFVYRIISEPNFESLESLQRLTNQADLTITSAQDALSDLAWLPEGNRHDQLIYPEIPGPRSAFQKMMRVGAGEEITNVQVPRMNDDTRMRLNAIPQGGNHRDLTEEFLDRYLTGKRWGQHNGTGRLSRKHFYAYRRLHPSMWSWTLNTKADSVYHFAAPRALSVREFARLQSFPDRFDFVTDPRRGQIAGRHEGGGAHSRYRQVGNAVPPLLAKAVANAIVEAVTAIKRRDDRRSRAI